MNLRSNRCAGTANLAILTIVSVLVVSACASKPAATSTVSAIGPEEHSRLAADVIAVTGAGSYFEVLNQSIAKLFEVGGSKLPAERRQQLVSRLTERIRAADVPSAIQKEVEGLETGTLRGVLDWYKSPTGQKYIAASKAADPSRFEVMSLNHKISEIQLDQHPKRAALIERFVELPVFAARVKALNEFFSTVTIGAVNDLRPERERMSPAAIQNMVELAAASVADEKFKKDLRKRAQHLMRSLSDDELEAVIAYLETPAARAFHEGVNRAIAARTSEAGETKAKAPSARPE